MHGMGQVNMALWIKVRTIMKMRIASTKPLRAIIQDPYKGIICRAPNPKREN